MKMGYHRDASHSPEISVFRGEMQRRIWAALSHLDLQTSCQIGLPRMIKEGMSDTRDPSNLLDEDFDENTQLLPPSRNPNEITPVSYGVAKNGISAILGTIIDSANSALPIPYDEVMRLDAILDDVHEKTPDSLRLRNIRDMNLGSPNMRVRRFCLDLCYHKARCVLHRKFMFRKPAEPRFSYSVKSCVDSSMQILRYQEHIYNETVLGKSLHEQKWKISSLTNNDFLLGDMILCKCLVLTFDWNDV